MEPELLAHGDTDAEADIHHFALFDFEPTDNGIELVVAMQPEQAFGIVRQSPDEAFNLEAFSRQRDLLAAFVEGRVQITQSGIDCEWEAVPDAVPETLLDAQANGVSVRGEVECPSPKDSFTLRTDLFIDAYPDHHNVVRYLDQDRFVTVGELDFTEQELTVDLPGRSETQATSPTPQQLFFTFGILIALVCAIAYVVFTQKRKHARATK